MASCLLVAPPSQAHRGGLEVYDQGTYDDPYEFDDDECGFLFHVEGRQWGRYKNYIVPGSDRQAFLANNRYHWRETISNPANGKKMYLSGDGHVREVRARHVEGTVWDFVSIETGAPFVMRTSRGRVVVADRGKLVRVQRFDTLGDGVPGGEPVGEETILHRFTRGSFPSLEPDFDFCGIVAKHLGATPAPR
ncbi:hypothetical protein [Nocardioides dongkuii]|uniref:hypothetical protein n=1 Tax=Nocardioides dongkuii TaxID=2760089 RepID=UPI0015F9D350|nr:hypothetical protein [Nocardioides dongkuii]